MKPYRILKPFNGSQHGNDFASFEAGSEAPLSDALAAIAVKEGWAEPVTGEPPTPAVEVTGVSTPEEIEARETKVVGPDETKPEKKPRLKKTKK